MSEKSSSDDEESASQTTMFALVHTLTKKKTKSTYIVNTDTIKGFSLDEKTYKVPHYAEETDLLTGDKILVPVQIHFVSKDYEEVKNYLETKEDRLRYFNLNESKAEAQIELELKRKGVELNKESHSSKDSFKPKKNADKVYKKKLQKSAKVDDDITNHLKSKLEVIKSNNLVFSDDDQNGDNKEDVIENLKKELEASKIQREQMATAYIAKIEQMNKLYELQNIVASIRTVPTPVGISTPISAATAPPLINYEHLDSPSSPIVVPDSHLGDPSTSQTEMKITTPKAGTSNDKHSKHTDDNLSVQTPVYNLRELNSNAEPPFGISCRKSLTFEDDDDDKTNKRKRKIPDIPNQTKKQKKKDIERFVNDQYKLRLDNFLTNDDNANQDVELKGNEKNAHSKNVLQVRNDANTTEPKSTKTKEPKESDKKGKQKLKKKKNGRKSDDEYDSNHYEQENTNGLKDFSKWERQIQPKGKNGEVLKNAIPVKVQMIHLRFGVSIPYPSFLIIQKQKQPAKFLKKLAIAIWTEYHLANRAFNVTKCSGKPLEGRNSPRKCLTPVKKAVLRKLYFAFVKKHVVSKSERQSARNDWRSTLGDLISYLRKKWRKGKIRNSESEPDDSDSDSSEDSEDEDRSGSSDPTSGSSNAD